MFFIKICRARKLINSKRKLRTTMIFANFQFLFIIFQDLQDHFRSNIQELDFDALGPTNTAKTMQKLYFRIELGQGLGGAAWLIPSPVTGVTRTPSQQSLSQSLSQSSSGTWPNLHFILVFCFGPARY